MQHHCNPTQRQTQGPKSITAVLLTLCVLVLASCSSEPAGSAQPSDTSASHRPPVASTPAKPPRAWTGDDVLMANMVRNHVPASFDTPRYARGVCEGLYQGYTLKQLLEGLMTLGLNREGAFSFVAYSVSFYCYDEFKQVLPDGLPAWNAVLDR